ncbi:MAG: Kef family K(+) transporter [Alphaproteobacteria bacterium]|nr:Kef family K(+) transporter [Alphaproteobacteria bacterium]
MPHETPLIATIVAGLVLSFVFGVLAQRLRLSPLVGYLVAGIAVGPFTPGFVADQHLATELAEIGVVLLMFGVGLHFSLKDLLRVRAIALPGAVVQMGVATALGLGLALLLGWTVPAGLIFGLSLSVASTVVLLRALQERRLVQTERGTIAVGWLIVEDLAMVLALVLIPALAPAASGTPLPPMGPLPGWLGALAMTLGKVAAFVAFMLVIGRRVIPWVLHYVAHTGSRELFRLAVLSIALGVAFGAATLFGVSFALGAFFAGMVLSESELSQRAANETLPLRDAFAVLFFVSVGMLFNPAALWANPWLMLATVAIIVLGKSAAALLIMRAFGHGWPSALLIAASLAQIGEFSFILAGLGVGLGLLPAEGRDLVLGAAIVSILLNPVLFALAARHGARAAGQEAPAVAPPGPAPEDGESDLVPTALTGHSVVVGYGTVGAPVAAGLRADGQAVLVVELDGARVAAARAEGFEVLAGHACAPEVLAAANLPGAARLLVAIPDEIEAGQVCGQARALHPALPILARADMAGAEAHLRACGASRVVSAPREVAATLLAVAREPA